MKTAARFLIVNSFVMGIASPAFAEVINVDLGYDFVGDSSVTSPEYVGTAAAPDTGTKWNGLYATPGGGELALSSGALVDSFNNPSPVTFTLSSTTGLNGFDNPTYGRPADYSETGAPFLVQDEISVVAAGTGTVVISGLKGTPLSLYDLYIYVVTGGTELDGPFTNTTTFTIGATSYTNTPSDAGTTGFQLTEDYLHFTNLAPIANQITISFTGATEIGYGGLFGFQLVTVPEPSAIIISGFAVIGMLLFNRRRNTQ